MYPLRRRTAGLTGAVALTLCLAACGSSNDTSSAAGSSGGGDAPKSDGASQVNLTLTSSGGCELDHSSAAAGPVTFTVTNKDAAAITEVELLQDQRIIGEKENLAPGLAPVKFTSTLGGGSYEVYCPGASKEKVAFTATGQASAAASGSAATLLDQGAKQYATYVNTQIGSMVTAAQALKSAVDSGDVEQAKKKYALARPFYEKIETDVDGFVLPGYKATDNKGNLDYLLDMRKVNLDQAAGWHGYHAVERDLWQAGRITGATKKSAAELLTNVKRLKQQAGKISYKPEDLANGAAGLLEEVQTQKIKGTEEAYSHIDLVDFAANVEGAQEAFAYLKPGLNKIDSGLTSNITKQFDSVNKALNAYRDPSSPGGFKSWTSARRASDAASLSKKVQALQDPLSKLGQKVATAG